MENRGNLFKITINKIKTIDFLPLIIAYACMIVFFSLTSPIFFTFQNFMNIALYVCIIGILACSSTLIVAAGKIDFSVGSVIALGSCVMGIMVQSGFSIWIAIVTCIGISVLANLVSGVIIAYVGISPFITTLAGMQIYRGIAFVITNARTIIITDPFLKFIGRSFTLGIPHAVVLTLLLVILFTWIARKTTLGRQIFVVGGNAKVAYLSGINVKKITVILFLLHGVICGIATLIYTAQLGASLPNAALNTNFQTISAVVLGGVSLTGGKGSIVGAIVGALLLGTLNNGMIMLDIQTFWQDVIIGFVLIFAVTLDIIKNRRSSVSY